MYDATGKTNSEVFSELIEMLDNDKTITLEELTKVVATRSVVDTFASEDALTIFYSGESETFINTFVDQANGSVRVIRRTEAYEFLADDDFRYILERVVAKEKRGLLGEALDHEIDRLLYEASYYDSTGAKVEGEGFWTQISRRFAADTKGDAYFLCVNAKEDRIFARDELATWLNNADDNAKMCG